MADVDSPAIEQPECDPQSRERVRVEVSPDRMSASLVLLCPEEGEDPIAQEEVFDRLAEARVEFGIDFQRVEAAVDAANKGNPAGSPVCVAEGKAPVHGEDGTITYDPCLSRIVGRPKLLADGSVDMFDLNAVQNVSKGTVLATVTMPTPGIAGATVTGIQIKAKPGLKPLFSAGKGTAFDPSSGEITATLDGHASLIRHEISVTNTYRIDGDLGLSTGNIDFVGSVRITGSICSGYWAKAHGDVEVLGSIEGAVVEAKGNVLVHGGIVGGRRGCLVKAGGSVKARFIEGAEVRAGGSVWAADGIVQSRIESAEVVEVLGRHGVIAGGTVVAGRRICARTLGSTLGSLTGLTVGVDPALPRERAEVQIAIKRLSEQLRQAELLVAAADQAFRRDGSQFSQRRLQQAAAAREEILGSLAQVQARQEQLERTFREGREAYVQASERCFPGVEIAIGTSRYRTVTEVSGSTFVLDENGEVYIAPRAPRSDRT